MKILISGGHLTPALALIEYIQTHQAEVELVFVGREFSQDSSQQKSQERAEVTKRGVPFYALNTTRLPTVGWLSMLFRSIQQLTLFGKAVTEAKKIFHIEQPSVFMSFGGYVAVPLAVAAWQLGIPIVTHEQTRSRGLASALIARLAQKIAVAYPESATQFTPQKVVVTGNPLRNELLTDLPAAPEWLTSEIQSGELPLLYVTGGNQGSATLNTVIQQALPELTQSWLVVHQCGNETAQHNYLDELEKRREELPVAQQMRYVVRPWITGSELAWLYHHVTAVVSRAGANTVQEVQYFGIPTVFVPLPFARGQEQLLNAQAVAQAGGALVLEQSELSVSTLLAALAAIKENHPEMKRRSKSSQTVDHTQAAANLFAVIREVATQV
jgi:UDP-N-acetylglucosamine--N-acetylmuramyl-(pentapeptide) pyrophosphoryl-undecaprenol N-acetylglucosamine transferase